MKTILFWLLIFPQAVFATNTCAELFSTSESSSFLFKKEWYDTKFFRDGWLKVLSESSPKDNNAFFKTLTIEALRVLDQEAADQKRNFKIKGANPHALAEHLAQQRYWSYLKDYGEKRVKLSKTNYEFYLTFTRGMVELYHAKEILENNEMQDYFENREVENGTILKRVKIFPVFFKLDSLDRLQYYPYIYAIPLSFKKITEYDSDAFHFIKMNIDFLHISETAQIESIRILRFISNYKLQQADDRSLIAAFLTDVLESNFNWRGLNRMFNDDAEFFMSEDYKNYLREFVLDRSEYLRKEDRITSLLIRATVDYQIALIRAGIVNHSDVWD